jgi:hypothetical protein
MSVSVSGPPTQAGPRLPIAVLVDFDNADSCAKSRGYNLSFFVLREYVRRYGVVVFAEAYLSPYSNKTEIVSTVWHAGFTPIACPYEYKDKDSVDVQIKARGLMFARHTEVQVVIIVSEDRDFSEDPNFVHVIRDLGKDLVFLHPSELPELAGEDKKHQLQDSPRAVAMKQALTSLVDGKEPLGEAHKKKAELIVDIIGVLSTQQGMEFKPLLSLVWDKLSSKWSSLCTKSDVHTAMTALNKNGLMVKTPGPHGMIYKLNLSHSQVVPLVGGKSEPSPEASAVPTIHAVKTDSRPEEPRVVAITTKPRDRGVVIHRHRA